MRAKQIMVLMGGWSEERDVSLSSAQGIIKALRELGHDVVPVDVTQDIPALIRALETKPDVVFNILHGTGGEDGVIQGILEAMQIPYTFSGVKASALAMDKVLSRKIFEWEGLPTPSWKIISLEELKNAHPFSFPYVLKPIAEGSSKGVYIIHSQSEMPDMVSLDQWGQDLLAEEYIAGREIQVAVVGDQAIGAIEICPKEGFYDYEAKYTDGKAVHLMPAPLKPEAYERVLNYALKAHQALNCRGVTRSDFRYDEVRDEFYILEINTQPGMTPLSLVPEIAAHWGVDFKNLIQLMIDHAQCDQPLKRTKSYNLKVAS